ncbi:hypothetical protein BDAP_002084 [Binucleata daphniae]
MQRERKQKIELLEKCMNIFIKKMINISSLQKKINIAYEKIMDDEGNTLKVLCENTLKIEGIINKNITKINDIVMGNAKLRGLIIRAEQSAKEFIEIYLETIKKKM